MNTKYYIGSFKEIASLPTEEQSILLEKARYEAFVTQGLASKSALYLVLCLLFGFTVGAIPSLVFGFHAIYSSLYLAVGIGITVLLYQRLYGGLLYVGLKQIL